MSKVFQEYLNKYEELDNDETGFVLKVDENGKNIKLIYFEDYIKMLANYKIGHVFAIEPHRRTWGIEMKLLCDPYNSDQNIGLEPNIYELHITVPDNNDYLNDYDITIDILNKKVIMYAPSYVLDSVLNIINKYFENIFRK